MLSNPPYIPSENIAGLQAEVGKHEPQSALDGGEDGMNDLRTICQGSSRALRSGGFLALEVCFFLNPLFMSSVSVGSRCDGIITSSKLGYLTCQILFAVWLLLNIYFMGGLSCVLSDLELLVCRPMMENKLRLSRTCCTV